jgi:cobalt-zinc-cadmium efflux system protein
MPHEHEGHEHGSHQHNHHGLGEKHLALTIGMNVFITVAEIAGGLLSGSLALLSDAIHNLSDVISLIISYIAIIIGKKDKNISKTYGYKRAEIIAALINVIILFFVCGYIIFEALHRMADPHVINVKLMLIIAALGVIANGVSVLLLFRDAKENMNIKSAFVHMMADTISSVAVIVTAVILIFKPWFWLDAVISILITVYIARESLKILMDSLHILMQGSPEDIDREKVEQKIKEDSSGKIQDVHHIHMWEISPGKIVFDAHIVVKKEDLKDADAIIESVNKVLSENFKICHSTIQIESGSFNHCVTCEL